jgi:hypothetical protein
VVSAEGRVFGRLGNRRALNRGDAAGGPLHAAAATGEGPRAANSCFESVQNRREADQVLQPTVARDLRAFVPDLLKYCVYLGFNCAYKMLNCVYIDRRNQPQAQHL